MDTPEPKIHRAICQCIFICYCIAYTKWEKRTRTCTRYVHNLGFQIPWAPRPGTSTPKPTCQGSESVVEMFDMQEILIHLLQCEKKWMWQNLSSPNELGFAYRTNGLPMGSLQPGDHCIPKQIRLSHNFKIIITGRRHIIVGNRENRRLGHYAHFGLHGLPAWTPRAQIPPRNMPVYFYVIVLLIQSEERERARVHDMSTIWGFRAHGLHARGTRTPKPTRQRSESMGMTCKKNIIYLLQCEKKSMWQNLTSPSMDSLTEQMGSPWAPSNPGITAYRNKSDWAIISK